MELVFEKSFQTRSEAQALIIPFWKREGTPEMAVAFQDYKEVVNPILDLGDFSAKEREVCLVYDLNHKEQRLILIGLGCEEKSDLETIRRAYAEALKFAIAKKIKTINITLPLHSDYTPIELTKAAAESILMTNYQFDYLSSKEGSFLIQKVTLITNCSEAESIKDEVSSLIKGVNLARDLINGNADDITPKRLVEEAYKLEKSYKSIKVKVFDKEEIQKKGMGLFYAVARSSPQDPYFIVISYEGDSSSKEQVALIGKGITYDTGGLSIKPSSGMETMKCDMSGAAAVLGTLLAAAELELSVNLCGIIAATENAIGSKAYKLGDVYQGYNKTTVEIKNTDAEGRLALADSLAYAVDQIKPTVMIDLATLTGAAEVALGNFKSPLFSNNEKLALALFKAGEEVGERLWMMPLDSDYRELITSKFADLKNSGGREGSLIFSAMFLKEFVKEVPWAHLDIAGTAFLSKPRYYHTTSATGYGVRLLIQYLKKHHVN